MQFAVDTLGRIDTASAYVLYSDHDLFTAAVTELLPELEYLPGNVGTRKARVVVSQRFHFRAVY